MNKAKIIKLRGFCYLSNNFKSIYFFYFSDHWYITWSVYACNSRPRPTPLSFLWIIHIVFYSISEKVVYSLFEICIHCNSFNVDVCNTFMFTVVITGLTAGRNYWNRNCCPSSEPEFSPGFSGVRFARSSVFCRSLFVLLYLSFGRYAVCTSPNYGIGLPLWYLHTFLVHRY